MLPTQSILSTWMKFDGFAMETLTKAWYYDKATDKKQREVARMREHRHQFGVSGNCFDLALWLLDECKKDGIEAYPIGHGLSSEHAHVAVIAVNECGNRYLCDLGDQWIRPVLVDRQSPDFTTECLSGFFPGARIQVIPQGEDVVIYYHRPNGAISKQAYQLQPIDLPTFLQEAESCQNLISPEPLVECRMPNQSEIAHWEFSQWESFVSTSEGLFPEPTLPTIEQWAERISQYTGMDLSFLIEALRIYRTRKE